MSVSKKFLKSSSKKIGKNSASVLSDREPDDWISTGSLAIDWAIGPYCRGYPQGKISQVYGEEQSGKSLLMCQALAEAQKLGFDTFLIDREQHYTRDWFERFGGDPDRVIDLSPNTVEEAFEQLKLASDAMISEGSPGGLFVIDSLQSLPTEKQYQADMGVGEGLAGTARFLSANLSGYVKRIKEANLATIFVGQVRVDPNPFGSQGQYTPGGNALTHYAVLRLKLRFGGAITEKDEETAEEYRIGFRTKVTTEKNNVGGRARGQTVEVDFLDYSGTDDTKALFTIAKHLDMVEHTGSGWFSFQGDDEKFRGKSEWEDVCTPEIREKIEEVAFDPELILKNESKQLQGGT